MNKLSYPCTYCRGRGYLEVPNGETDPAAMPVDVQTCPMCGGTGSKPTPEGEELARFIYDFYGIIPAKGVFEDKKIHQMMFGMDYLNNSK
jgi:DnaJ-class molecular chaperone